MLMWIRLGLIKPCLYWAIVWLSRRQTRVFESDSTFPECGSGSMEPKWMWESENPDANHRCEQSSSHTLFITALLFVQHCKPWPASWFREFGECWNTRKRHYKFWSCQLYRYFRNLQKTGLLALTGGGGGGISIIIIKSIIWKRRWKK